MSKGRRFAAAVSAVAVVVSGILVVAVLKDDRGTPEGLPSGLSTTAPAPTGSGPLIVKVDNTAAARPQQGVGSADVVYVEPVEGGLTRLVAVYRGNVPEVVGPVRSVRETDLELLAPYGGSVLAFSGSAPELVPLLESSRLRRASPVEVGDAYFRDDGRAAPHNLFVRTSRLPRAQAVDADRVLPTGLAPPGGRPTDLFSVAFPATAFDLTWSAGSWAVSMDRTPVVSADSGPVSVAGAAVLRVPVRDSRFVEDTAGQVSPVATTTGTGAAVVLRDGVAFDATWSRPTTTDPMRFTAADGTSLPLAPGRNWVFLVPA